MKTVRFVLLLFIAVLFCQCKSSQQILRLLNKDNILLNHKKYNRRARKLLVSKLSPDVWKNDTIIILESSGSDPSPAYSCWIYESKEKKAKRFLGIHRKPNAYNGVDSLKYMGNDTYYVQIILNQHLDEFKRLGEKYKLAPNKIFRAYILTKEKGKRKFAIQTVKTNFFYEEDPYDRIWYERIHGKKMPER